MAEQGSEGAAKPGKERGRLIVALAIYLLLVLAGAAGGAWWWWWMYRSAPIDATPPEAHVREPETAVLAFEPFVVNLADPDAPRFLRAGIQLVIADKHLVESMQEDPVPKMRVRSAILELLAQQTSAEVVTPDGKAALKKAIAEQAAHVLGQDKVRDVLFSDFVVQF